MSFIKEHKSQILVVAGALLAGVLSFFITIAVYNPKVDKEISMLNNDVNLNNVVSNEQELQVIDDNMSNNDVDDNSYIDDENFFAQAPSDESEYFSQDQAGIDTQIAMLSEPIIVDALFDQEEEQNSVEINNEDAAKEEVNIEVASNEESKSLEVIEAIGQSAATEKMFPISGEIVLEFAKDKLVYSETLDEWIVHDGIDILGEESEPVKVVEDGIVESVKMDPRYGNTIIVNHGNNVKTVYSNLSTLELVFVGKEVKRGDIISGVGKGFGFESKEGSHVHFEIIKNGECVDPSN